MQGRVWQAGSTRARRTVGLAATVGMTAAVAAAVTGAGAGVAAADDQVAGCAQSGPLVNCMYSIAGEHALDIPAGVTSVKVTAIGEAGQNGIGAGGLGGRVTADLPVTPGSKLYILVGEGGGAGGGFSGTATESIKQDREKGLKSRTLVAPGGGDGSLGAGGNAGAAAVGAAGGKAGTATAGGAGGSGSPSGAAGVLGDGGAGVGGGGDGGAGYFGGGGGAANGGGGGGSFLVPAGGTDRLAASDDEAMVLLQFNSLTPVIPIPGLPDLGQLSSSFGS
ncbi:hypothetical protein [Rhodococcus sp. NPDC058514]|uniref:hypothetical protein n=1 Tax=unclassified Rhodococcus (in: high G+C Gram-positive bacteria) TaxID=192944 RepID=UPI00364BF740